MSTTNDKELIFLRKNEGSCNYYFYKYGTTLLRIYCASYNTETRVDADVWSNDGWQNLFTDYWKKEMKDGIQEYVAREVIKFF